MRAPAFHREGARRRLLPLRIVSLRGKGVRSSQPARSSGAPAESRGPVRTRPRHQRFSGHSFPRGVMYAHAVRRRAPVCASRAERGDSSSACGRLNSGPICVRSSLGVQRRRQRIPPAGLAMPDSGCAPPAPFTRCTSLRCTVSPRDDDSTPRRGRPGVHVEHALPCRRAGNLLGRERVDVHRERVHCFRRNGSARLRRTHAPARNSLASD